MNVREFPDYTDYANVEFSMMKATGDWFAVGRCTPDLHVSHRPSYIRNSVSHRILGYVAGPILGGW